MSTEKLIEIEEVSFTETPTDIIKDAIRAYEEAQASQASQIAPLYVLVDQQQESPISEVGQ